MLSAGKVEVRVGDYATLICGGESVGNDCRTNVTAQLQSTVDAIEDSKPAKIVLNYDLEQAITPVVDQCASTAVGQLDSVYQAQLTTYNAALAKYNTDKAAYDRDKAAYDAWAAADPATRDPIAPWDPEKVESTPPTPPTQPTPEQVRVASSPCIRDTYMAADGAFRTLIAGAATRAREIQENNFKFKGFSESAEKSMAVFCGDNSGRQRAFKAAYKTKVIGMDDPTIQHFDAILLRITLEKKRAGFDFGGFMDDSTKVKLPYMGTKFDCVDTLMKAIAVGAYETNVEGVPIETLYIPSSLGEALAKVDGLAGDDASKKEIYDRAMYLFYETLGGESTSSAQEASVNIGKEIALFVNSVLGSNDTDAQKIEKLQTAFKTKFLLPKDGGFKVVDVPAEFLNPEKLGLAKGAAIPVDLEINLRRLYLKTSKDEKDDAGKSKVAAALVTAVKGLKIDNADKLTDALATFDAKVKKDDKGSYTVAFDPFTTAPASLLAKLNITDDLRKIAMGFIWDQVVAQTPENDESKKEPTKFLAALLKSKEFRARSGSADALLLTEVVIGKDGSVKIEALPEGLHAGNSQLDIRDAGAYGAIQTKKKISELYLKAKTDKKLTNADAAKPDSDAAKAVEASRTAVEGAAQESLAAVVALDYKGWGEKGPDIGPVEVDKSFSASGGVSISAIDGNYAPIFNASFKKRENLTDTTWYSIDGKITAGSSIKQRLEINNDLLLGPTAGKVGGPRTGIARLAAAVGKDYKTDNSKSTPSAELGLADGMVGLGGLYTYNRLDAGGEAKWTLGLTTRLGKPANWLPDSVLAQQSARDTFILEDNYLGLVGVSASAVWGKVKPSLKLNYRHLFESDTPDPVSSELSAEFSLPLSLTATAALGSSNIRDYSNSERTVAAEISRPIGKKWGLALAGRVTGERVVVGGVETTLDIPSNHGGRYSSDGSSEDSSVRPAFLSEHAEPGDRSFLGAGLTLDYVLTDSLKWSFDFLRRFHTEGYYGTGSNNITTGPTWTH